MFQRLRRSLNAEANGPQAVSQLDEKIQTQNIGNTNSTPAPKLDVDVSDLLEEADNEGSTVLLRRPDRISVSYYSPPPSALCNLKREANMISLSGMQLSATPNGTITIDRIQEEVASVSDETPDASTLFQQCSSSCALMEGSNHSATFFDVGDTVEYACGVDCRQLELGRSCINFEDISTGDNIQHALSKSHQSYRDVRTELYSNVQEYSADKFVTTVCVSTNKSISEPMRLCQATVLLKDRVDLDSYIKNDDFGMTFAQRNDRLIIESISNKFNDGWFGSKGCAIKAGHILVGINEFITSHFSPEDVIFLIKSILCEASTQLSITTIASSETNTPATKWDKVRKAAAAVGGGTMVGAGAILMVTPLHPVGHAMAIGGVSVLGTQFEAPRKVMNSAKERLSERRLRRRESSNVEDDEEDNDAQCKSDNSIYINGHIDHQQEVNESSTGV